MILLDLSLGPPCTIVLLGGFWLLVSGCGASLQLLVVLLLLRHHVLWQVLALVLDVLGELRAHHVLAHGGDGLAGA